jgi:hypothetical protein
MNALGPGVVYPLCLLTSVLCAGLLIRSYARTRTRLLLWSAVAFTLLALNNLFVVVDMNLLKEVDFTWPRQMSSLAAVCVLLYAFIWELD